MSVATLPFKRVVIYKHGVAYFEREGTVDENGSLDLAFKPSEMNDIIRSLRVVDLNGGRIANISYPAASEDDKTNTINQNNPIYQFLIGSNVKLQVEDKVVTGRVLSSYENPFTRVKNVEILIDNAHVKFIDASKVQDVEILDPHINGGLKEYLDKIVNSKKKDKRQVSIECRGTGKRNVRVSYVLENPIWKSSYRVYMKQVNGEKQYFLEGLACVDNTSEDDWTEVSLALVSGSPISFQYEVYNPILGVRPDDYSDKGNVVQQVQKKQKISHPAPTNNHAQLQQMQLQQQMRMQQLNMQQAQQQVQQQMQPLVPQYPYGGNTDMTDVSRTQAVEIGNLFHYEVQTPITVKKDHSSLVPTISGPIKARQVCWFDPQKHAVNPMVCLMMLNTMGVILDKGPVIITEDDNYLGESLFENTIMPDENKLLPYGANLDLKIMKEFSVRETPHSTHVFSGSILSKNDVVSTTTYEFMNNSETEVEMLLDHDKHIVDKVTEAFKQAKYKDGTRFYVKLAPLKKTIFKAPVTTVVTSYNKQISLLSRYDIANLYCQHYLDRNSYSLLVALFDDAAELEELRSVLHDELVIQEDIINDQKRLQSLHYNNNDATIKAQINTLEKSLADSRAKYSSKYHEWRNRCKTVTQNKNTLKFELNFGKEKHEDLLHISEVSRAKDGFSKSLFEAMLADNKPRNGGPFPPPRATQ